MPSYRPCQTCGRKVRKRGRKGVTGVCWQCYKPKGTKTADTIAPTSESLTERGDVRDITRTTHEQVRTLNDLIRVCEIDVSIWDIVEWHANKWEMGYTNAQKQAHTLPIFQVKARLRRKTAIVDARAEIEVLKELAKVEIQKAGWPASNRFFCTESPFYKKIYNAENLLEIDIFDLHLGKLAWSKETGYQNYDLKIAKSLFEDALEALIRRTNNHTFDHVLLPVGNDFFHSDSLLGETTAGTRQDMDGRFHKSARIGREMIVAAIERLRQIAPVTALIVSGNHDQLTAWHLGDSLECYFHRDDDVTIDNLPMLRKYHEFGNTMLMFTHGHRGKHADYPLLMASEHPEMWGRTKFREAHIGHWHKTEVNEYHGVRIRTLSSLCAADAWHSEMMFVGQQRQAEAFVWSRKEGLVAQATYTVMEES